MKIITINVPETDISVIQSFVDDAKYESRSEFVREAIKDHLELLSELKKDIKIWADSKIITVNLPSGYIDEMEAWENTLYASRSELIRDAVLRRIEKDLQAQKELPLPKITFDEELAEYVYPIIQNDAYKTYKIIK